MSVPRIYEKLYARVMESAAVGAQAQAGALGARGGQGARELRASSAPARPDVARRSSTRIATKLVFAKLHERLGGRLQLRHQRRRAARPRDRRLPQRHRPDGVRGLRPVGDLAGARRQPPRHDEGRHRRPGLAGRGDQDRRPSPTASATARSWCAAPTSCSATTTSRRRPPRCSTREGWLRTGDIGYVDDEGFLHITDRKKELIKTAGGKYVAPQPIENALKLHPLVEQAVVIGDRRKYCVALVVPNFEALQEGAGHARSPRTGAELNDDPQVRSLFQAAVDKVNNDLGQLGADQALPPAARGADAGDRRADPDAEDQAPRGRGEVQAAD